MIPIDLSTVIPALANSGVIGLILIWLIIEFKGLRKEFKKHLRLSRKMLKMVKDLDCRVSDLEDDETWRL